MTALALLAVLPASAARTLGEPGTLCVPGGGLLGLCTAAPDLATAEGARAAVLAQHDLLVRVALAHDLVPVRSGAVFSDRGRVAQALADQGAAYRSHLARIAGSLEVSVTVRTGPVPAPPAAPVAGGLAYLRARSAARSGDAGQDAHRVLATLLADSAADLPVLPQDARDPATAAATVLVPRHRLAALLAAVERWAPGGQGPPGVDVQILGPWPCYTFTTAEVHLAHP